MADLTDARTGASPVMLPSPLRRAYVVLVLMLTGSLSIFDRQVMTIMVEPIRHELKLSDSQIGFLTGIAFSIVYTAFCLPAARLADRWSRTRVLGLALSIWSVMTMLCGMSANFLQLAAARFGVGFGEAGGMAARRAAWRRPTRSSAT